MEAEQKKKEEQQAALSVRRVIQKIRLATPLTFDDLKAELTKVQEECQEKLGCQAEKIEEEIREIIELARKKVEFMNEVRRKEEEKKQKDEIAHMADVEQKIDGLLQELDDLIEN